MITGNCYDIGESTINGLKNKWSDEPLIVTFLACVCVCVCGGEGEMYCTWYYEYYRLEPALSPSPPPTHPNPNSHLKQHRPFTHPPPQLSSDLRRVGVWVGGG